MIENKFNPPYPWDIRDEMDRKLMKLMDSYPYASWKEGYAATGLMLNSASHPSGKRVLDMITEDTLQAIERGAPFELINFALRQVDEWRKIMLKTQPRVERTTKGFSLKKLKDRLKGKLSDDDINKLFA